MPMLGLLLRPFRTLIFLLLAGMVGYGVAQERANDACQNAGGRFEGGICRGVE
ncbi:MAG: hypothetical protein AAF701_09525 [Pseudomonadota bacterium]